MKDKVEKLLSLTYLNKEAMPKIIKGYVYAAGGDSEELVERVLAYTQSTLFLDFASQNFFKVFTEQEVDQLLEFYASDVARKLSANSNLLSDCIYQEIARFIKDEIAASK